MKKYVFLAVMALAVIFTACNSSSSNKTESATAVEQSEMDMPQDNQGEHTMLGVRGSCEMCKETIETTAKGVDGVTMAVWDMESKELHMNFDPQKTKPDMKQILTKQIKKPMTLFLLAVNTQKTNWLISKNKCVKDFLAHLFLRLFQLKLNTK